MKQWWRERRSEIVEVFDREIYGRVPPKIPGQLGTYPHVKETNGTVHVIRKELVGHVDNSGYPAVGVNIQLTLSTPVNASGPVPVTIEFALSPEVLALLKKCFPQTWSNQMVPPGSS